MTKTTVLDRMNQLRTKLLAEREALLARVHEIDAALGTKRTPGPRAERGARLAALKSFLTNRPGASLRELLAAMPDGVSCRANRVYVAYATARGFVRRAGEYGHGRYYLGGGDAPAPILSDTSPTVGDAE
jgi:hypothetical protein